MPFELVNGKKADMEHNSKITIIIPIYKVEKYLHRCIDSVLNQTYKKFTLILVDDGSPDSCGDICEEYAGEDSRIVALHRKNGGLSAARNTGIEWSLKNDVNEYLTFIDSDDWVHPQYLEELLYAIKQTDATISVCCFERSVEYKNKQIEQFTGHTEIELISPEDLLIGHEWNYNYAWGKLYKKEYFRTIRYPEGKNFEDVFTTYKVLFAAEKIAWSDGKLYYYFVNSNGISKSPWTPRELVVLEGMQQQMKFYRENGYKRALAKEEGLYVNHFAYQICRIRENKKDYHKNRRYIRQLKREMMHWVQRYPEKYGYKEMPQCYEAAYPRIMKLYHMAGIVIRKVVGVRK